MADNVLIATANDSNGAHQKVVNEYLDAGGLPVSVTAATPLPVLASISTAGLATSTGQTAGNNSLASIDGKTSALGQQLAAASSPVVLTAAQISTLTPQTNALTDTQLRATPVPVSVTGGGDATAANQTTEITKLTSIDGKVPALGQALAAASTPVVLTAAQLTTLTPPAAITGFALAANQQTNAITDAQIRATPLPVSGTVSTGLSQPLTDTQLRATAVPVSGTVTANTGLSQPLTDTQLRATPVPVSGTVTSNAGTNLNTSLLALESGGNLAAIKLDVDKIPSQGQALAAASMPVVLTAIQQAALTPPAAITGFNLETTQALVKAKTDNLDVALSTRLKPADTLAGVTAVGSITNPLPTGTNIIGAIKEDQANTTTPITLQNAVAATGNGTNLTVTGYGTTVLQVTGTFVATINFETSVDAGATWTSISTTVVGGSNIVTSTTTPGTFRMSTTGLDLVRARVTWTSGTSVTVRGWSTNAAISNKVITLATGTNTIGNVNQTIGTTGFEKITDGTNTAAVKAASTAAVAADPALVVAISPNNTVPISVSSNAPDVIGTGNLTALNQAVTLSALNAMTSGYIQLSGTWVGSIQLEGSLDNFVTLTNLSTTQSGGAAPSTNALTANGFYRVLGIVNHIQIRARCSAFTSGTIAVTLRASSANGIQPVISTNALGFLATATIDQTTPGTTNKVSIGTDGTVAINAALPTGANTIGAISNTSFTANAGTNLNTSALNLEATQSAMSAKFPATLGQKAMAASMAVVLASDQASVPVAATLSAETTKVIGTVNVAVGSNIIGKVGIDQTTPGTTNLVALAANQSVNNAQVNGVAVSTGTGVMGTGTQRVTIASDNDPLTVKQATAANLNATVVGTGTFAVQATPVTQVDTFMLGGVNIKEINAVAPLMGNGVTGTGSQRVTLASDGTAISTAGFMSVKIDQTTPGTTNAVTDTKLPASAAAADALANPTITQIGADGMLFNGTSWDRARGLSVATTTGDTGAKTATGNGATQTNVGNKGIQIMIVLGTVSGTTPTAVFKIQGSVDGGTTFYDVPGATTASLVASVNVGIMIYPGVAVTAGAATTGTTAQASSALPRTWRVVWTIGGTTPSFAITSVTYNYLNN